MNTINFQAIIFGFLGGLGLFLFSIKYMGDGLKLMAGDKIRYVLDKYTTNPFLGVLVGIFVTILLQSSSAATVITVGLVAVGLLNLKQAIGIVMGSNIGTTITSFIIGFNLSDYALPIMFLGAACLFFTSNKKVNNIGRALFGFGGIFFSLTMMSESMVPLRNLEEVQKFLIYVGNKPGYGVLLGTVLTVIIQSSAATIGIVQNLYTDHLITLHGALPILFGNNIGTTITAILSVIGANVAAKRVAVSHVLFNVIGTVIFMIVLSPFTELMIKIEQGIGINPKLTIATAHGLFNLVNTIIMFPFIGFLAYIVTKIVVDNKKEEEEKRENYLDKSFIGETPAIALSQAQKEMLYMYRLTSKNFLRSITYFLDRDEELANKIEHKEQTINEIDNDLTRYLSEVFSERLTERESEKVSSYLDITRDIERIGDHANNLSKEITYQINKEMKFSDFAIDEILTMKDIITDMLTITYSNIEKEVKNLSEIYRLHNEIYEKEHKYRKNHIDRMKKQECDIKAGMHYVDVLNHLTRVCDHLKNINERVI